jgi:hypothetical protein
VKQPFKIVDEQVYAKLGGNETLKPSPSIVHFGGYTLGESFTQVLSIVNTSHEAQRLHVISTTTPFFSVTCNKKGVVAPGMAEKVVIKFTPTEWRYYYDCVRIHCAEENLLIPIHAYPVANDVFFPTFLDFGGAALLDKVTRTVSLSCKVPIQFEYELSIVKPHSDFEVSPLRGVIPAHGSTEVSITYCPVKLGTAEITLEVNVSQFNFKPFICRIVGNAAPGITRNRVLKKLKTTKGPASESLTESMASSIEDRDEDPDAVLATTQTFSLARKNMHNVPLETYDSKADLPWHGLGSGAAIDAGGAFIGLKVRKQHRAKTKRVLNESMTMTSEELIAKAKKQSASEIPEETVVDGIRIPRDLSTMTSVNFVLTQEVGKLKPKDLKRAVAQQRALREKRRLEQEALKQQSSSGAMVANADSIVAEAVARVKGKQSTRQLKEMVFLQELRDLTKMEEDLEFQTQKERLGNYLLSKTDIERISLAREESAKAKKHITRASERRRFVTHALGPLQDGEHLGRAECTSYLLARPERSTEFDIYANNVWLMRKEVLQRFINAVNTTIIRSRVKKRYNMLRSKLRGAGVVTREDTKAFVERDNRIANNAGGERGGKDDESKGAINRQILAAKVDLVAFDEYSQGSGGHSGDGGSDDIFAPVDAEIIRDFDHLKTLPLRQPMQAKLLNYDALPTPSVSMYMPMESNRELRTGAEEEEPIRISVKVPPAPNTAPMNAVDEVAAQTGERSTVIPLPKGFETWLEAAPIPLKTLLVPDPSVRPFMDCSEPRETDPEFVLKPEYVKFDPPQIQRRTIVNRAGCSSVGSIEGVAMVSTVYRPCRQHRYSALSHHDDHRKLWDDVDKPIEKHQMEDLMSETDSDEEPVEDEEPLWPTVDLCRTLFEHDPPSGETEEANTEEANVNVFSHDVAEDTDSKDLLKPIVREARWVKLYEERKKDREERSEKFQVALSNIDNAIQYPRFKFSWQETSI